MRHRRTVVACLAALALTGYAAPACATSIPVSDTTLSVPSLMVGNAQTSVFNSIALAGARLVAVGEHGRIVLSDDQGVTWRQVASPTSVTLTSVRFTSAKEGWAVGQMGAVLHSTDAGANWRFQFNGVTANTEMLSRAKLDIDAPGADKDIAAANLLAARQFADGGPSNPFLAVLPVSAQDIIIAGAFGMVFTSADGGATFQPDFDAVPNPNGFHIYAIVGDGNHQILGGEQGLLLKRGADGGFTTLKPPLQGSLFGGLRTRAATLIMFGIQGEIIRSTDDGVTWSPVTTAIAAGIDCGVQLQDGRIMLGDEAGDILISGDDGASFTAAPLGEPVIALQQTADGGIVRAGLHGLARLPPSAFTSRS